MTKKTCTKCGGTGYVEDRRIKNPHTTYEAYLRGIGHSPERAGELALLRWQEIEQYADELRGKGYNPREAQSIAVDRWESERDRNPKHREKVGRR